MTIQLELSPEAEKRLAARAHQHGVEPAAFARTLLQDALDPPLEQRKRLTVEEFHAMLREMARGSENLPDIPTSAFTRESFYEGRD